MPLSRFSGILRQRNQIMRKFGLNGRVLLSKNGSSQNSFRHLSSRDDVSSNIRCVIVGSGPAGFYTAKYLLEKNKCTTVDMIERLPTPYGLVRQGVAPDHQEVKSVMTTFTEVAMNSRFRFFGNVTLGCDTGDDGKSVQKNELSILDLQNSYDVVVLAYGASSDKNLNIPGENIGGVLSARNFVNWYNGHPYCRQVGETFDLKKIKRVVVIGQGNVAIDCARILMKSIGDLEKTDISSHALEALRESAVEEVVIVGRRGHIQASFTIKEIRELTRLPNVSVKIRESELQTSLTDASKIELLNNRSKHRIVELINKIAAPIEIATPITETINQKCIDLRFLLTPIEIFKSDDKTNSVGGILLEKNILIGEENKQKAVSTGEIETIKCELILKSVGYQSESIDGIPFDFKKHIIPNKKGRVYIPVKEENFINIYPNSVQNMSSNSIENIEDTEDFDYVKGLYVSGWLKRGPSGIVGTNINDAKETVDSILHDISSRPISDDNINLHDTLLRIDLNNMGRSSRYNKCDPIEILSVLKAPDVVTWEDYLRIEKEEEKRGLESNPTKPREKICNIEELLFVAKNSV